MLIGLCGVPGSGKSSVTDILVEKYGFEVLDMKETLRRLAAELTGLTTYEFVLQEDKVKTYHGVQRRTIMGELGNAVEGMFGDTFLLDQAIAKLDRANELQNKRIVVDSLRKSQPVGFPGLVVEVISDKAVRTYNDFDEYDRSRINSIIVNMGTMDELEASIVRALKL